MKIFNRDQNTAIIILLYAIFFVIPFDLINHSVLYFLLYALSIFGVIKFYNIRKNLFLKYYGIYIAWSIFVTIFSVDKILSLRELIAVSSVLFIFLAIESYINDMDIVDVRHTFNRLFVYFSFWLFFVLILAKLPFDNQVLHFFNHISKNGSRLMFSTLSLFCVSYALFFLPKNKIRIIILLFSICSNFIYRDGCFWFILLLVFSLYFLALIKISIRKLCIILVLLVILLLIAYFVVVDIMQYNLHIYERVLVFRYWMPHLLDSPFYGVGLGLRSISNYYTKMYPVPVSWMDINPFIKLHAHNIFIDLALEIGFIGLGLFSVFLYKTISHAIKHYGYYGYAYASMLVVALGKNSVDDFFEGSKGIMFWLIIIISYLLAGKYAKNNQQIS